MKLLTMTELARLTRAELAALYLKIQTDMIDMPEGSEEFAIAEANLESIRAALARRTLTAIRRYGAPSL